MRRAALLWIAVVPLSNVLGQQFPASAPPPPAAPPWAASSTGPAVVRRLSDNSPARPLIRELARPRPDLEFRTKTDGSRRYCANQFLVKPLAGIQSLGSLHQQLGTRTLKVFRGLGNLQVVEVPPELQVEDCIAWFDSSGMVEYAEPDHVYSLSGVTPNDPHFSEQWALHNTGQTGGVPDADIDAPEAWEIIHDAPNVVVAVLDTGVDYNHEDLDDNIWINAGEIPGNGIDDDGNGYTDDVHGIDTTTPVSENEPLPSFGGADTTGHGTLVTGVIGAEGNNSTGISGVCWQVQIMVVKVTTQGSQLWESAVAEGVEYAVEQGADVINLSYAGSGINLGLREVLTKARNRGVTVVAGMGNANVDNDAQQYWYHYYPASYELDNIVAVGASNPQDARWYVSANSGSNYGQTTCDLMAPGEDVLSTIPGGAYMAFSGSSFATPHVSGALALLKARFPEDSYLELINRLLASVDPIPAFSGLCVTGGRLNLFSAVSSTSPRPPNDDWQSAFSLEIPSGKSVISGMSNNIGATKEPNEPDHAGVLGGKSVWWKWAPPTGGGQTPYFLHTQGSGFPATLAVYIAYPGGGIEWTPVATLPCGSCCSSSCVELTDMLSDVTYLFAVDGVGAYADGPVRLTLSRGANDSGPQLAFDEATIQRDLANGTFGVRIIAEPNTSVLVEMSDILLSPAAESAGMPADGWSSFPAPLYIPAEGYVDFSDNSASSPQRFYRFRRNYLGADVITFSCNSVGYLDRAMPAGFSLLSNPLVGQSICIPDVFSGVPAGFAVYTWNEYTQSYLTNIYRGNGVWSGPDCLDVRQGPGFGCFVYNPLPTDYVHTFKGHVWQGYFEDALPGALTIRSAPVPDHGRIGLHLGVPQIDGMLIYLFRNGSYEIYDHDWGEWLPFEPWIDVGDAFWIRLPDTAVWKQHYWTWPAGGRRFD